MAKLAIYMNEGGGSVLHRTGFSWLAAIAPTVWALQHRLYATAAATFVISTVLTQTAAFMPSGLPRSAWQLSWILIQVMGAGFGANWFHRIALERSGYFMTSAEQGRLKGVP